MLTLTDTFRQLYPGAQAGVLAMENVANPSTHPDLDACKAELEKHLRSVYTGYTRPGLGALPSIKPYISYYARFDKTYHLLLQVESVALKGKALPRVAALVECMFMAEIKNHLLTAGHDLDLVRLPLRLDAASGAEHLTLFSGLEQALKPKDMFIADQDGVLSSVLYGPDKRTPITPQTKRVLFTVYAPQGIAEATLRQHLADIEAYVRIVAPEAGTITADVFCC